MLQLSGIQHFRFCPRQWALVYIEQQWQDNGLTKEGEILHKHVDDPFYLQKRGDHITLRAVRIASHELGLYGVADIIELRPTTLTDNSIRHPTYQGLWKPIPIEYKHGKPKHREIDEVQLVAQAMCLEEMYGISVNCGAFFYGAIRHRVEVEITPRLRDIVRQTSADMHEMYQTAKIPVAKTGKHCTNCSLNDICMPKAGAYSSVKLYLSKNLFNEEVA